MRGLLRTLSVSYLRRHPGKTLLAVLGIAMGVATFVSVKAAQQTLAAGFQSTVDRLAGRADLQIAGVGGVPEHLQERLRDLSVIEALQPVIEQVVEPEDTRLGSLLVLGVDLVGDTQMRAYGFDGDDADVDDPLVFLAQPDSVALSRDFAARAGIVKGDALGVRIGGAIRRLTVRALLEPKGFVRAYGGNIAVTDVYAAEDLFGRGRRFDRIDVRLIEGAAVDTAMAEITGALGPGYRIKTPEQRGAALQAVAKSFVGAFDVTGVLALGIGLFLIFNVFAISVQRRRRDIGVLRALGAMPWQIGALFLIEAAGLGAIGGAAGVALGSVVADRPYRLMGAALDSLQGLSHAGLPDITLTLMMQGIGVGILASIVGALAPAIQAARVAPVDAMAPGVFLARQPQTSRWIAAGGVALLILAFLVGRFGIVSGRLLLPIVTVAGALGTVVVAGRSAWALIVPLAPALGWLAPASGRVAADALLGRPRRTAATAAVLTVSAAFVLGTAGYLEAVRSSVDRWVANVVTADLIVRASPGLGPSAIRLPYELRGTLLAVPGVAEADAFRQERIDYGSQTVALVSIEAPGFAARTRHEFVAGDDRVFAHGLTDGQCAVSDNFSRRFSLGVGDVITLDSPTGPVHLPIGAVVVDYISDRGTIMIDRSLFTARWADDRVDAFHVTLTPDTDPDRVRDALRAPLPGGPPLLVATRQEFVDEVGRALGSLYTIIQATVVVALFVALMGIASSLLVSVTERSRDIGILRALGAVRGQVGGAVVLEAVTLALVSLLLAVPLGELLAWFLRARVSENFAGFRFPRVYPLGTFGDLLVGLPVVGVVATWLPARWAAGLNIAEAISYE